ncbi:MAG: LysM peptidoglycan-binding domain-containing protein [Candidatus Hydrogenedentes bacterium]|nr:LysM peptidoglycan-binding domain-containing protein [Candidatus Hydrogenedentota bacterium]
MKLRYIGSGRWVILLLVSCILVNLSCAHKKQVFDAHFTPTPIPEVPTEELAPPPTMFPIKALRIAGEYFQEAKEFRVKGDIKNAKEKYLTARRTLISGGIVPGVFKELREDWEVNFIPESEKKMKLDHLNTWRILSGLKSSNGKYSEIVIPFPLPERVIYEMEDVINRYPKQFQEGLNRSGLYLKYIREKFAEQGLPEELCWLVMIESMFQTKVNSPSNAGGMWQFIRLTAKHYGLIMDPYLDERYNWVASTRSAIDYLKDLHNFFAGDWSLAISAYNMGENGLKRVIEASASERNFWRLIETHPGSQIIKDETKKYYPRFLAYIFICNDPSAYGFSPSPFSPLEWDEVYTDGVYSLSILEKNMGYEKGKLSRWNPFLIRGVTPPYPYKLMVPKGDGEKLAQIMVSPTFKDYQYAHHTVRKGESAYSIAHRYGITIEELLEVNALSSIKAVKPGIEILVPTKRRGKISFAKKKDEKLTEVPRASDSKQLPEYHEVKKGETLYTIAKKYNLNVEMLAKMNNLKPKDILRVGDRLKVRDVVANGEVEPELVNEFSFYGFKDYTVKKGDTLGNIAKNHSVSINSIKEANNLQSDIIREGQSLKIPLYYTPSDQVKSGEMDLPNDTSTETGNSSNSKVKFHIVEKGDTLSKISNKYSIPVRKLMEINNLSGNSVLRVGQKVYLDTEHTSSIEDKKDPLSNKEKKADNRHYIEYTVQPGDNLWNLAKRYNTEISLIEKTNQRLNPFNLKVGTKIIIPVREDGSKVEKDDVSTSNLESMALSPEGGKRSGDNGSIPVEKDPGVLTTPKVYVVQKGDTLIGISKKTGMSVDKILELNNWRRDKVLKVGDIVKLE